MPDKKQCWTCEIYADGQIFALNLQNVVLFKKLSQTGQPKQVIFWLFDLFLISKLNSKNSVLCSAKVKCWDDIVIKANEIREYMYLLFT